MCACVWVYPHVCVCPRVCVHVCVCVRVCAHVFHVRVCPRACIHVCEPNPKTVLRWGKILKVKDTHVSISVSPDHVEAHTNAHTHARTLSGTRALSSTHEDARVRTRAHTIFT